MQHIIKRDGSKEQFHSYKIEDAIQNAYKSKSKPYDKRAFYQVMEKIDKEGIDSVEEIQDMIEKVLYELGDFAVMKSFITYRFMHKMQREHVLGLNKDTTFIDCSDSVQEYIKKEDWRINANANTGYSNSGLVNNLAGKVIANYWLDKVYSKQEGAAHRNGDLHIHDLDCLTGYCAGWSLRALLNEGFNGVRGRVESKAPKHLKEALGQMANFLGILQSEWAGAQAFSSFDTYLSPYLFADDMDYEETKKAIRSFVYNLNVPSRWGQSPFTNITIDWTVPDDLKQQIPTREDIHLFKNFVGNEALEAKARQRGKSLLEMTYKDFQPEMDMINRAYYEVMTEGDRTGQPFTFPIPTVNITEEFDWYGKNTDVLFENSAKIGSSYFQNFIGSQYIYDDNGNKVEDPDAYKPGAVRSMCCRLQLDLRELLKRGNGLFGSAEMTGSIGVVTINMARLGYLYKGDKESFYSQLDRLLEIATSTLEKKRVVIKELFEKGLFPYTARYLPGFDNHFATIGVNGMNEMVRNFSDDRYDISSDYGEEMAIELLDYIRDKMKEFQERTGNLYNLEATPAEGTTYRFAKEDKKRYSDILQAGFGDNIYYTNSSQLPVDFTTDPFEALLKQDKLQTRYTGGTVLHLYMNEKIEGVDATREFLKSVMSNFRLPYVTVTPLFSVCPKHGYLSGEHEFCPKCDDEILRENKTKTA
ncbi:MAG: ribonucleoside triphosphate reductase [Campylobacterota bacterium]